MSSSDIRSNDDALTHLDSLGQAHMVDVGDKNVTRRVALAQATVRLTAAAMQALVAGNNKKGDVLGVARIAGIQASKQTSQLIPLCHPIALTKVSVEFDIDQENNTVTILARCETQGVTGVEMEALTAVSTSALTIYDMCKAVDKGIVIENVCLLEKTGGKSGDWSRQ